MYLFLTLISQPAPRSSSGNSRARTASPKPVPRVSHSAIIKPKERSRRVLDDKRTVCRNLSVLTAWFLILHTLSENCRGLQATSCRAGRKRPHGCCVKEVITLISIAGLQHQTDSVSPISSSSSRQDTGTFRAIRSSGDLQTQEHRRASSPSSENQSSRRLAGHPLALRFRKILQTKDSEDDER